MRSRKKNPPELLSGPVAVQSERTMRAVVVRSFAPLRMALEEASVPDPGATEIRIRVRACGVSFVDALTARGEYQVTPDLPYVPGSECAGIIDAIGPDVTGFRVGDAVCALAWGGPFAEYLCVDQDAVALLPPGVAWAEAAVLRVAYTTAWHALKDRGALAAGERLLVLGAAGSVGQAAIELGKILGATVIAAVRGEAKRAAALAAGADTVIDISGCGLREAWEQAGLSPVDVVLDPVGGDVSDAAFRLLGWGGRHLVVGFAGGAIPAIKANIALLKGASLVGVNVGRFNKIAPVQAAANLAKIMSLYAAGEIRPRVGACFTMEAYQEALDLASGGKAIGRIALMMDAKD
ncbi:NADPH:quinone oxidoreductase family protein [Sphingobium phenoxybenzoativorans]|uniref:NADPH:quinone oxidoreductase family protein n=1 Tax=Sphingobium phenoxybenzoativorans TaxID=1592790 RepID=A0A975K8E9_9SPHN|nr:NADPH:quinone oxidoreductase family protein [Sphingobium phenoxybenzoativorans]QUT06711.1 NADPH:quinone oxidoreductase family protein [Sphingobium phenoxybenzoativorans]